MSSFFKTFSKTSKENDEIYALCIERSFCFSLSFLIGGGIILF